MWYLSWSSICCTADRSCHIWCGKRRIHHIPLHCHCPFYVSCHRTENQEKHLAECNCCNMWNVPSVNRRGFHDFIRRSVAHCLCNTLRTPHHGNRCNRKRRGWHNTIVFPVSHSRYSLFLWNDCRTAGDVSNTQCMASYTLCRCFLLWTCLHTAGYWTALCTSITCSLCSLPGECMGRNRWRYHTLRETLNKRNNRLCISLPSSTHCRA